MVIVSTYKNLVTLSDESKETLRPYIGTRENQDKFAHPNRITFYGAVSHGVGLGCLASPVTAPFSLLFLGVGLGADVADGEIARQFELCSEQGAKLDPLFDKVKNFGFVGAASLFGSLSNPYFAVGSALSLGVDYISQRQRGNLSNQFVEAYDVIENPNNSKLDNLEKKLLTDCIKKQESNLFQANTFGKVKTLLQSGVHLTYASMVAFPEIFSNELIDIESGLGVMLGVSATCGFVGVYERLKKSKGVFFLD
jgi:hypothetical protein